MFLRNKGIGFPKIKAVKKASIPTIITRDMNILGTIISDGTVDFSGTLDGNIRAGTLTVRANAFIKGELIADTAHIYGNIKGLIRAKNVHLYATCNVEGIIMHEHITIEDGAFIDGKCKRTDKVSDHASVSSFGDEEEDDAGSDVKMLENIRLIS